MVRLPYQRQPLTDESVTATTKRRILVVDDNRDPTLRLSMMLNLMGNSTHTAHDGLSAVKASEKYRPDMILLNFGLPKMNGYACRASGSSRLRRVLSSSPLPEAARKRIAAVRQRPGSITTWSRQWRSMPW